MPARRFFVEGVRAPGERVDIRGGDARKIVRVLRLRDGDALDIVDSSGTVFAARIAVNGLQVVATLGDVTADGRTTEPAMHVDVAQALPKGQKMDFVVEKATELGAAAILPFDCERTVAGQAGDEKIARWRRLASAAAAQSARRSIPRIHPNQSFETLLERFEQYDAVVFAWELAPHQPLLDRLTALLHGAHSVLIVIGPEGGFTHEEAEAASAHGAQLLWLGPRILRTETAGLVLLAIIGAI